MESVTQYSISDYEEGLPNNQVQLSLPHTSNRSVCFRVATCLVLIVVPIFIASTFITYFLMKNTSLGNQNYLHEYAIYAFIIFSVASVFPFGLFFLVVLLEKIHAKYRQAVRTTDSSTLSEEEANAFSANIFERQAENEVIAMAREAMFASDYVGRRNRRGTLSRQDAFDCPPGYDDLALRGPLNPVMGQVPLTPPTRDEQPPSYEMAIRCTQVEGHSSFEGERKPFVRTYKVVYGDEESPPAYDEKTMKT